MNEDDIKVLAEIDALLVGQVGNMELSVYGNYPQLVVRTQSFALVSKAVKIYADGNTIIFYRDGKKFRGNMRVIECNFKFRRVA